MPPSSYRARYRCLTPTEEAACLSFVGLARVLHSARKPLNRNGLKMLSFTPNALFSQREKLTLNQRVQGSNPCTPTSQNSNLGGVREKLLPRNRDWEAHGKHVKGDVTASSTELELVFRSASQPTPPSFEPRNAQIESAYNRLASGVSASARGGKNEARFGRSGSAHVSAEKANRPARGTMTVHPACRGDHQAASGLSASYGGEYCN